MTNIILRLPEVLQRTGLSRSSIYAFIGKGRFPRPLALGERSKGWLASEVEEWIKQRAENRPDRNLNE